MLDDTRLLIIRFLRWSEKYTKTDMVYLAKGSFWLSSSSIITAAVSFALAVAFANLISQETYGNYKYVLSIFGILCVSCLRGMDTAITQAAARGKDGSVVPGLYSKMRWSLLGSLGALAVSVYYFYFGNATLGYSFIVAAFFIPFMEPFGIFNAVLVGKKDFRLSSILGSAGQITAAIIILPVLIFTKNPILIFAVYCATWSATRLASLLYTLKKYPPNDNYEQGVNSYAFHATVIGITSIVIGSIDSILVFHFLGAANLAIMTFALAPVSQFRGLLSSPSVLAVPKLANQSSSDIKKILYKRSASLFLMGAVLTIVYCILAIPFFHIFFPKYTSSIPFSMLFSITIMLQVGNTLVGPVINSRATLIPTRLLYLWNLPSVVIAVCALVLIPVFGIWGAVTGQLLSYGASCGVIWLMWFSLKEREHPETQSLN